MTPPVYFYSAENVGLATYLRGGSADIVAGLRMYRLWVYLGCRDFLSSTKRTLLGSTWTIVAYWFKVICLGYIYTKVLNEDATQMFIYVAAGLALWDFISTIIGGGLHVFFSQATLIKERADPISSIALRYLVKTFLQLGYRLIGFAVVCVVLQTPLSWHHLLVVPGIVVYLLIAFPLLLVLGSLGARFRDLSEVAQPVLLLLFLISPVLWHGGHLGAAAWISEFNPITHVLEIVREPMMGVAPSLLSVGWVGGILVLVWGGALLIFGRAKDNIVFWV